MKKSILSSVLALLLVVAFTACEKTPPVEPAPVVETPAGTACAPGEICPA